MQGRVLGTPGRRTEEGQFFHHALGEKSQNVENNSEIQWRGKTHPLETITTSKCDFFMQNTVQMTLYFGLGFRNDEILSLFMSFSVLGL